MISETRSYNLSTSSVLKLTNNLTRLKCNLAKDLMELEPITLWNCVHFRHPTDEQLIYSPTLTLFSLCCFSMALKVWFFAATSDCFSICSSCSLPICPWSLAIDSSDSRSSRAVSCCCFRACSRSFFSFLISTSFWVILPDHSSVWVSNDFASPAKDPIFSLSWAFVSTSWWCTYRKINLFWKKFVTLML